MSLHISQGGGRAGSGGGGGGRDGDDGHRRSEAWRKWVRSAAAKKRGAWRWTNWGLTPPPLLRDYAPGGRFFHGVPELVHHHGTARARIANGGKGSSGGGGSHGGPGFVYARTEAEEEEATAAAIVESAALNADTLAVEQREEEEAIAAVAAMEAREAAWCARLRGGSSNAGSSNGNADA